MTGSLIGSNYARLAATCAAALLAPATSAAQEAADPEELLEEGRYQEQALKRLDAAVATYRRVVELAADADLRARALLRIAGCERKRGREAAARELFERVAADTGVDPDLREEAAAALEGASEWSTRAYDLELLLRPVGQPGGPGPLLRPSDADFAADPGKLFFDAPGASPRGPAPFMDPDAVEELVVDLVGEDRWDEPASIEVTRNRLLVHQRASVHRIIAALVDELSRLQRLVTLEVRIALVSRALWGELGLRPGLLGTDQAAALETRLRAEDGARALADRRLTGFDREPLSITALESYPYLGRYRLEQTGVVPTVEPVVEVGQEGLSGALRPTVTGDGRRVLLEGRLSLTTWDHREAELHLDPDDPSKARPIQLPRVDQFELQTTVLLPSGRTALLGGVRTRRYGGGAELADPRLVVLVRASAAPARQAPAEIAGAADDAIRLYDVAELVSSDSGADCSRLEAFAPTVTAAAGSADLDADVLLEVVESVLPREELDDVDYRLEYAAGRLVVRGPPGLHDVVARVLEGMASDPGRLLAVEALRLDASSAEIDALLTAAERTEAGAHTLSAEAAGAFLAERPDRETAWAGVACRDGHPALVAEVTEARYLTGYQTSAGGTGMVVERKSLPTLGHVDHGLRFAVRPKLLEGGRRVLLALGLELSALRDMDRLDTPAGPVHFPRRKGDAHTRSLTLPTDRVLVLGAESAPGAPGQGLLLLRVRVDDVRGD